MADATIQFVPATFPEAVNIKPGSYTQVRLEEDSDESLDKKNSNDTGKQGSARDEFVANFWDINENPNDKGSFENSKIVKSWHSNAQGLLGLENKGVTCYMNSAIQVLLHLPAVAAYLSDVAKHKYKSVIKSNSVTFELATLFKKMAESKKRKVYPQAMIKKLPDINCMMSQWEQEDAHEYFMSLIGRLQEDGVPKGQKLNSSIFYDIFGGTLKQQVVCKRCKAISTTHQDFYDLCVGLTKELSIESSIKEFFSPETLKPKGEEGYQCEKCKQITKAYKISDIERSPEYLCVQLKRFRFDGESGKKMQEPVSYPMDLDLSNYSVDKKEVLKYKLMAVIVHEGRTVSSGHYIALCRQPNNKWCEYDDELVENVTEDSVRENSNAYVLIYSRLTQKPASSHMNGTANGTANGSASGKALKRAALKEKENASSPPRKLSKIEAKRRASSDIDELFKKK